VVTLACLSLPSPHVFDSRGPIARAPELPVLLVHRRHHFMHSMREDRLQERPSCQCCLCIDAIISCTRCARTDCKSARVASVACASTPSLLVRRSRGRVLSVTDVAG